jgi:putative peptidoglycan lipid II flippase
VLSEYASTKRDELWRAASVLLSAAAAIMGLLAIAVFALAPVLANLLAQDLGPEGVQIVERCLRFIAPAVLAFGLAGVLTGLLFALERFALPAASGAVYNAAFIITALLFREQLGVYALPLGVTAGGFAQVLLLLPGLRDAQLIPALDLHHPALRRVIMLYLPIGAGLLISQVQVAFDIRLASQAGTSALAWMRYATTLVQFPHGLVAVAISLAILPRLSATHARFKNQEFARILARAVRVVLTLSLPAGVGLAVLAQPVVAAVFEGGKFGPDDTAAVRAAVLAYLIGLPFASVDWPLNYAFFARQRTIVPAAVGVAAVGVYLLVAVTLGPIGNALGLTEDRVFLGLVIADSAKHMFHATVMIVLVRRAAGAVALSGAGRTAVQATLAAIGMGLVVLAVDRLLAANLPPGTLGWLIRVAAGSVIGVVVYVPLVRVLGCREIDWLWATVRRRLASL